MREILVKMVRIIKGLAKVVIAAALVLGSGINCDRKAPVKKQDYSRLGVKMIPTGGLRPGEVGSRELTARPNQPFTINYSIGIEDGIGNVVLSLDNEIIFVRSCRESTVAKGTYFDSLEVPGEHDYSLMVGDGKESKRQTVRVTVKGDTYQSSAPEGIGENTFLDN